MEPAVESDLAAALASGALVLPADESREPARVDERLLGSASREALEARPGLPHGARVVLRVVEDEEGPRCVFLERLSGNTCAVHSQLGSERQAAACRLFPRVALRTPLGVSLTLSHYCPSAADLLFDTTESLRVVEHPPAFPDGVDYEGLDAQRSVGPLLRPGVLLGWDGLRLWEEHVVSILAEEGPPEIALERVRELAELLRLWTPASGEFLPFCAGILRGSRGEGSGADRSGGETPLSTGIALELWRWVAAAVPDPVLRPEEPWAKEDGVHAASLVEAAWTTFARPVRLWLAGRAFASWLLVQGDGLRTFARSMSAALGVLRAEAGRGCLTAGRPLDRPLLREAIRRADLLLVHLVDPERLARNFSRVER